MVKQMFEAVHFDTPFNQILEEAAEWKQCKREQANKKKASQTLHQVKNLSNTASYQAKQL